VDNLEIININIKNLKHCCFGIVFRPRAMIPIPEVVSTFRPLHNDIAAIFYYCRAPETRPIATELKIVYTGSTPRQAGTNWNGDPQ